MLQKNTIANRMEMSGCGWLSEVDANKKKREAAREWTPECPHERDNSEEMAKKVSRREAGACVVSSASKGERHGLGRRAHVVLLVLVLVLLIMLVGRNLLLLLEVVG